MNGLETINKADKKAAAQLFRDCCGSKRWAELMALSRPFESEEELFKRASEIWNDLENDAWFEAFAAHPKIGGSEAAAKQRKRAAEWSKGEQAGMDSAGDDIRAELARVNQLYEEKFGFIFIVCATGKAADAMLGMCRARLKNDPRLELKIAAEEQRKITEIRLRKLLEQ